MSRKINYGKTREDKRIEKGCKYLLDHALTDGGPSSLHDGNVVDSEVKK